jgi:tetratricopeptide (TPR) repeat protein
MNGTLRRPSGRFLPLVLVVVIVGACGGQSTPSSTSSSAASAPVPAASPSHPPPSQPSSHPSPAPGSPTQARIAELQAKVAADPTDAEAQRDLGFALLERIRETADASLYAPAERSFEAARRLTPDDAQVLVGIGGLQLGRHQFALALETGREAVRLGPNLPAAHEVVVDALVELGRYDDAGKAAGLMLGAGLELGSLARWSYVRELHGDLVGALAAMRRAAEMPGLAPENTAFAQVHLANLLVWTGDRDAGQRAYEAALAEVPNYAPALAGLGRLAAASGDLDAAARQFAHAAEVVPLPEYVIALGEAQEAAGDLAAAGDSYALATAEIKLFETNGVVVDLDLALFEADHGRAQDALRHARTAFEATPTVRAADALAWALHRLGRDREAARRSKQALRLGSRDPLFHFHAGAIAAALGDTAAARRELSAALKVDPGFSPTGAAEARRLLDSFD